MKILYLCADPGIPTRGHKGAAIHVRALIEAFSRLGHEVSLVSAQAGPSDGPQPRARLIAAAADTAASSASIDREQAAITAAEAVLREASEAARQQHFDLIYERYSLWSTAGARLASETGLPYLVEVNAPLRLEASRYRTLVNPQAAADIEALVAQSATALVAVSEPLKQYLVDRGAASQKVHVIPNAVDDRMFHPGVDGRAARLRLGLDDKFVVGFVGTTRPWHDLDTLISAFAQLRSAAGELPVLDGGRRAPYHLLLIGDFPKTVRAAIIDRGLTDNATILGPLPQQDIPPLLAAMDVAVSPHPALPDFYFSPLKLFEYLACGRATVAAHVPPIAAVVQDGSQALLYRPGDAQDLAGRIASLAADPARREAMGMAAAAQALQHHTWIGNARRTLELIDGSGSATRPASREQVPIWDERLGRALYRATRLDLANAAFSHGHTFASEPFARWNVLKYWPGRRCVIAYETADHTPEIPDTAIIGKVYRDGKAAAHFDVQKALWTDGFGATAADKIVVAEPLAYIPEMNMLVQDYAPGRPLDQFLDAPNLDDRIRLAAAAIAKLHGSRLRPRSTYSLENELSNLGKWAAQLAQLRPELAPTFERHLDGLRRMALDLPPADLVPIHRDFYYSQLLFSGDRVTLIDLDLLALGDPAIDVSNFEAHLQFLAIQFRSDPHALDRQRQLFVREYLRRRPMSSAAAKLAFYERATLFRLLHVALTRPAHTSSFDPLMRSLDQQTQSAAEAAA